MIYDFSSIYGDVVQHLLCLISLDLHLSSNLRHFVHDWSIATYFFAIVGDILFSCTVTKWVVLQKLQEFKKCNLSQSICKWEVQKLSRSTIVFYELFSLFRWSPSKLYFQGISEQEILLYWLRVPLNDKRRCHKSNKARLFIHSNSFFFEPLLLYLVSIFPLKITEMPHPLKWRTLVTLLLLEKSDFRNTV